MSGRDPHLQNFHRTFPVIFTARDTVGEKKRKCWRDFMDPPGLHAIWEQLTLQISYPYGLIEGPANDKHLLLCPQFCSSSVSPALFRGCSTSLAGHTDCGDSNITVKSHLDKSPTQTVTDGSSWGLSRILHLHSLADGYREANPTRFDYTFYLHFHGTHLRIDLWAEGD